MTTPEAVEQTAAGTVFSLSPPARRLRLLVVLSGCVVLGATLIAWNSPDILKYATFLAVALAISSVRLHSPGGDWSLPVTFFLILYGVADLTTPETVFLAVVTTAAPAIWRRNRERTKGGVAFNIGVMALGAAAAERAFNSPLVTLSDPALRLGAATLALFLVTTIGHAALIAMDEQRNFVGVWQAGFLWSLPYYLGGAVVARLMAAASGVFGWQTVLLTCPVVYLIYRSYSLYLSRLEDARLHAEEMAALHLRTIEALTMAIEAKDNTTHDHLQRVQIYAEEMGRALALEKDDMQALRAAALLHDIGKLAVPEHIISKPGRLTPEEFEKMKIHPIVGAEILERVRFPYPVVPIVRSHHEKWDGSGYPYGLVRDQIPVGARILAAVDCLDALASDRQYRRAMPLDQAMEVVRSESGKAFDPRVVEVLAENYVEWERMAHGPAKKPALSTGVKVELGEAPAAGFESANQPSAKTPDEFLNSIAAARTEVQTLFEIAQDLGSSLSLDETLSVLNVRLRKIIPLHSIAIWLNRGGELEPAYVNGDDYRLFSALRIPLGQGLSGWVAENRKPIVNGNPSVESGYLSDPARASALRSAVAVPLEGTSGRTVGVLTLYHADRDAFTKDHLRILSAISTKIGVAVDNALLFRQVESSATTDYMTKLPNARSLFMQLDSELSRARRNGQPLTVAVLDMDGLKTVNDRLGHLEGNRVLSEVAAGLKAACRDYDYVARMGGDEFVMLIPGLKAGDSEARQEALRDVIAHAGRGVIPDGEPLTASIGMASFPDDGHDAEALLSEADRRMYQEKRQRKNTRPNEPERAGEWTSHLASLQVQ